MGTTKPRYPLAADCREADARWGFGAGPLTAAQAGMVALMAAAQAARGRGGIFYDTDRHAFVLAAYAWTDEEIARGRDRVQGGVIGYESYLALHRARAEMEAAEEAGARAALAPVVGMALGTLRFGYKDYRNCRIEEVLPQPPLRGSCETAPPALTVSGTRGNRRYRVLTTARAVLAQRADSLAV